MAQLGDPRIAAGPSREPRAQVLEEAARHLPILAAPLHLPPGVQVAAPRQRDEVLGVRPQLFRLRLGRHNPVVAEQAGREIGEERLLVTRRARQLPALGAVPHYSPSPSVPCGCGAVPGLWPWMSHSTSATLAPVFRPSRGSCCAIRPLFCSTA